MTDQMLALHQQRLAIALRILELSADPNRTRCVDLVANTAAEFLAADLAATAIVRNVRQQSAMCQN